MAEHELDAAVSVWREANVARGALANSERTARVYEKLAAPDATALVAVRGGVVGMTLVEAGREAGGAGELDRALLHISMVFVRPSEQRTGVGHAMLLHVIALAQATGRERVDVWTAEANAPARALYEGVGMRLTGHSERGRIRLQVQYGLRVEPGVR